MNTRELLFGYARKATVAALASAVPVAAVQITNITSDGRVSGGEIVVTVGAVLAAALAGFGLTFKAKNKP